MFKQEGYDLMGAAFEVYNTLGYGMAEEIYQQSLEIELGLRNIPYESKAELKVAYKGQTLMTVYRPDLLVFGEIVVELKAVKAFAPRTRGPVVQLHANQQNQGWLSHQLWFLN